MASGKYCCCGWWSERQEAARSRRQKEGEGILLGGGRPTEEALDAVQRPQRVTNYIHGLCGLLTFGAGGGLLYFGVNAAMLGKSTLSLAVMSFSPPAAIAIGVVLLAIGLSLLGLLIRDKYYGYSTRSLRPNGPFGKK